MTRTSLDVRGRRCPVPILLLTRATRELSEGDVVEILSDDPDFPNDVRAWCVHSGNVLLSVDTRDDHQVVVVERRLKSSAPSSVR